KFHTVKVLTQAKEMFVIRPKEIDHSLASYNKTCLFHSNTFYLFPGFSIKKLMKIPPVEMVVSTIKATLSPGIAGYSILGFVCSGVVVIVITVTIIAVPIDAATWRIVFVIATPCGTKLSFN